MARDKKGRFMKGNKSWGCKELWDIGNGITLCEDCHKIKHRRIKK